MEQSAETIRISSTDYYDFIDPLRTLTDAQRLEKAEKILDNMPGAFPKALSYVMRLSHITIEQLAENAHISPSTIDRYKRFGRETSYNPEKIVAMCIAMHLPPWLSTELLKAAGISLTGTRRNRELARITHMMFKCSVDEVQESLTSYGGKPLKLSA